MPALSGNRLLLSVLFLLIVRQLFSQPLSIVIKDSKKEALVGATVSLIRVADSVSVFTTTGTDGYARFDKIDNALYNVNVRFMGFVPLEKTISVKQGQRRFEFNMQEAVISLGEVTVVAKQPLVRQEDDKTIIDPEPLANTSTNTLEILEKTPGVFVDQDGGIFLNNATAAAIYINGREQKMSSQDINTILRSLPPGSIQRIEIMRTPSSKYDAASSGGIVNIILKKGVKIGRFGSINLGMNQGAYGNRFAGFSINSSGDKITGYLNANVNRNEQLDKLSSQRQLSSLRELSQSARTVGFNNQGYAGFGVSYDPSSSVNISYDGRINGSLRESSTSNFSFIQSTEQVRLTENDNNINNNSGFLSVQQDLGVSWKLDTIGSEWDVKFSYNYNDSGSKQDYLTTFLLPFNSTLAGKGESDQGRNFFLAQTDLTLKPAEKIKLETGAKTTFQDFSSQSEYFFKSNEILRPDPSRTNAYDYQERISAAYAQASVTLPYQLLLKTGIRMEHTYMNGQQKIPTDTTFKVSRADWFPYLYLSRKVFSISNYELRAFMIYRRTIERPGYQSLNPSIRYVDQYLYEAGNPSLKPQFNDNFELNISFDETPIFAVGRSYTRDIFSSVVYQSTRFANAAIRTYDNIGQSKETYLRITGAIPPAGRYFFVAGAQYNLNEYDGIYEGKPLTFTRGSWRFFTYHSLRLLSNTRLTMMGFMMHKGQMNFYELETFGQLNFGLNQSFFDKKLNITINARDVLGTMSTRFNLNQGSMAMTGMRETDSQRVGVNIRYTFGIRKKAERPRMPEMEQEEPN